MADSIPLSNAHLLKGLMPPNPHTLVPVESLTNSPTSSTGSASVLEWNSNSDSELFQMSSPASGPALTAQPTSSPISPFSTTPSPVGSSNGRGAVIDTQYIIDWPELACESVLSPRVPPAPVSNDGSSPATVADIDNVPALNEHPEELNALIEKMFLSGLHDTVSKWQTEASIANSPEGATQESTSGPKNPSPYTPEETSMTSTVLGYVHYDHSKDEKQPHSMTTASPPTDTEISFFDAPSPVRSSETSIISIAEYFKRKATERATPAAGTDQQISIAAAVAEERPASAYSALSYFSPSTSPTPHQSTAPGSEGPHSPHVSSFQDFWDLAKNRTSFLGSDHGHSDSDAEEQQRQGSILSTEVESAPPSTMHSPVLTYPYTTFPESFRYFNRQTAPLSGPTMSGQPTSTSQVSAPKTQPTVTLGAPSIKAAGQPTHHSFGRLPEPANVPSWVNPPELEFRTTLKNTNSTSSNSSARTATSTRPDFATERMRMWFNDPIPTTLPRVLTPSPASAPAIIVPMQTSAPTSTRKPRPPLPAVPTAKPPTAPTPPFTYNEELPKPSGGVGTPFAKAFPSAWTCRSPPQSSLPSLPPTSPALFSDTRERKRNVGRDSVTPVPPPVCTGWNNAQVPQNPQQPRWVPAPFAAPTLSDSSWDSPRVPTYSLYGRPLNNYLPSNRISMPFTPYTPYQPPVYGPIHSPIFGAVEPTDSWMAPGAYPPPPSSPPLNFPISGLSPPRHRRLRFATPPSPPEFRYRPFSYMAPPCPTIPPIAPHLPPVRPSPAQGPMRGMPYQNLVYSSPAPVIPPEGSANAGWLTTHSKYSFGDATVTFRVEATLFNVHRHFFERHSKHFIEEVYWCSEGNHIFLPDVKKVDFERLLSIFYPTDLNKRDITTLEGWTSVLTLARKWDMAQVCELALENVGDLATPMEKIIIAHKHKLHNPAPAWLFPAYKEVCGRLKPLTLQEAEQLDMATVIKIWEVQDEVQHELWALGLGRFEKLDPETLGGMVKERFGSLESAEAAPRPPSPSPLRQTRLW